MDLCRGASRGVHVRSSFDAGLRLCSTIRCSVSRASVVYYFAGGVIRT